MPGVHKITPILEVETVEPELPFWVDRLGFRKSVEVPDGDRLGFVILVKEGVEVMLQSTRSLKADLGISPGFSALLYLTVSDLAPVEAAMTGAEVVVPRRKTFYGAHEVWVRSPGGHVVGFAQHGA